MKDLKNYKLSFIFNIIIVIFTVIAIIMMFTGFNLLTYGIKSNIILESSKLGMFKFFTVDSNLLMGIAALIFAINEYGVIKGRRKSISKNVFTLKYIATCAVSLTFFVVFTYLGPINVNGPITGIILMLQNSNLFFHLLIPVLSIITFVSFERSDYLKYRYTFLGVIPMLFYSIFYMSNVFLHIENGLVSPRYDFYYFVQNGIWTTIFVAPFILLINYGLCALLWRANKRG